MTYGIAHKPLTVVVQGNRRKGGHPVAFLDGQICFFDRREPAPAIGETVEIMIVRPIHPMDREREFYDFDRLSALEIRVVDRTRHMLVAIDGFEMFGSGCAVSAFGCTTDGTRPLERSDVFRGTGRSALVLRDNFTVTPGRSRIRHGGEVYGQPWTDGIPTNVWVDLDPRTRKAQRRTRVPGDSPTVRVAGLTRVEDLECAHLVRRAPTRMAA